MNRIRKALPGPFFLFLFAAVMLAKVTTDYDHNADFSKFRTFRWIREPNTKNPLMKNRIVDAVNEQLNKKNLTIVQSGEDMGIAAHAATQERHTLQTFYDGMDGWNWRHGFGGPGIATTTVDTYEVGTLVVDLFDSKSKEVVWRGAATETLSDEPEKNAKKLEDAVEDMFKKYPPKEAKSGN